VLVQALESRPPGAVVHGAALEAEGRALRAEVRLSGSGPGHD
jgi:hypothetical protein